jgi:1-deoxy-D-xylulose-5-phosphate reductoisomerase
VRLAREAGSAGGTAPAVYNAANEVCVQAFLRGETRFTEIVPTIQAVLAGSGVRSTSHALTVEDVLAADAWARAEAAATLARLPAPGTSPAPARPGRTR